MQYGLGLLYKTMNIYLASQSYSEKSIRIDMDEPTNQLESLSDFHFPPYPIYPLKRRRSVSMMTSRKYQTQSKPIEPTTSETRGTSAPGLSVLFQDGFVIDWPNYRLDSVS